MSCMTFNTDCLTIQMYSKMLEKCEIQPIIALKLVSLCIQGTHPTPIAIKTVYYIHFLKSVPYESIGHLTRKSEVLGSIPGLATYFRFSFR